MTTYTVGGLLAALKPAGYVYAWVERAYARRDQFESPIWYDKPYRLHKTELIDDLRKIADEWGSGSPVAPYYVQDATYIQGKGTTYERRIVRRNVYIGAQPGNRPNVVQDGDPDEDA